MTLSEYTFQDKNIEIKELEELDSSLKIKSYEKKLKMMNERKIPLKPIKEVIEHFFLKNQLISKKTKNSISKIFYCENERIILLVTSRGMDVIWNRDKLIRKYGWFFYIIKPVDLKRFLPKEIEEKQKKKQIEEITLEVKEFEFEDLKIVLKHKKNMRPHYRTKEYDHYMKVIEEKNIPQMDIKEVLNDFFFKNEAIPMKEKKSIRKMIYYVEERVIVVKCLIGDKMYESLDDLVEKYGWYFYITGVPVGKSEISVAIDKIEKRYTKEYFKNISLIDGKDEENIRVTIYPIVLKPNHNCHILGIGKVNILIDCGISENNAENNDNDDSKHVSIDDFKHIEDYLKNYSKLIQEAEKHKKQQESIEEKEESNEFNDLNTLKHFEDDSDLVKMENNEVLEPIKEEHELTEEITHEPKIDAIFISHSHYDHVSGLKHFIELYPDVPILCSRITLDLFLLRDSNFLKQESKEEIEEEAYKNIVKNVIYVENGDKIKFKEKNCYLSFFHAGHMPGALMMLAKINDFRFLYTGDYTYYDVAPFAGTKRFLEQISRPIDYLLVDGTCANEDHGNLSDQFHSLILFMEQKAEYEDNVLIGADPSSLAISFMLTFWRYFRKLQLRKGFKKRPNIYVDMMVRKNIQVINHRYEYIYGPISRLIREKANPFNSIKFRWFDANDLEFLRQRNNIIISHPPDLSYGIIRNIINVVGRNPHNLVFLAGSIHEQPGLDLINGAKEIVFSENWRVPFRALLINTFVPDLQIKLHADKNQLAEMIKILEPKEVCFFHKSAKNLIEVAAYVKELGVEKVSLPQKRKLRILN